MTNCFNALETFHFLYRQVQHYRILPSKLLRDLHKYQNKQRLFPQAALSGRCF